MAVKGKGKQVAADSPGSGGVSGSGGKRRKGSDGAGPSSSSAGKRRRRSGVSQFFDDAAGVDDDYEEEEEMVEDESEEDLDDGFFTDARVENASQKRTERSHPLPFLVKEEELSGDELEEFIKKRYSNGVKYAADRNYHNEDDNDMFPMDGALKEPTIWRVKCMIGRERQMAFCFMQKFVDLQKMGTKVPIITAFALDHVRGFVFVEAEKACDVTEACKGFCSVYASRTTSVPAAEVPSLLSSRTKPFEISRGTWVRMKNGNYKGDLAQVVTADDGRKRVMIKLIPRVDLRAISKKYGGAISLKEAAVPAPRLISSQELEFFGPHIEKKRDRQTGELFEVLDGLMFKDGFLYKKVALSSLIYWGIQPTETELLKFSSSPSIKSSTDDLDWVSSIYGSKKRNVPVEGHMKPSSSKMKSSKASNLKASTSTEDYDDNGEFNLHDLVLFGRKDFGVVIAVEKDGLKILKGGPEGSAITVRKQDIKKSCEDKMFTAVDHQKKIISINDTVKVLEGPSQGKQGVVKHLYMGILFIYDASESDNFGFFCAQCGSCENIKKRKEMGSSATENLENPVPMFSEPTYEQNEHRDTERPRRVREELFSVGQMLRIRKGPLKGYLCRVVRIFRNDVTVKLDSLLKIVTVQAELLSVPSNRGDTSSGAPAGNFGNQGASLFGSEADKTSWDNGPSLGSDPWQTFSNSTLPVQNADGESEVDPWCKKMVSTADGDSDPWGNKTVPSADGDSDPWCNKTVPSSDDPWGKKTVASADGDSDPWGKKTVPSADGDSDPWGKKTVPSADDDSDAWGKKTTSLPTEVWNTSATQKGSSSVWGKQAGVGSSDTAGSSWDTTVKKVSDKSDNWGEACKVADMRTGGNSDPWGSKVHVVDTKETDSWAKAAMPPENKLEDGNQGWGQPSGKSNDDQGKGTVSRDADRTGAWDAVTNRAEPRVDGDTWATNWNKSSAVAEAPDEAWGKGKESSARSEDRSNGTGSWNKAGSDWDKPKSFGGDGSSSWNKGDETRGDDQNSSLGRPGRGFGRGRGRGRSQESGGFNGRNDQGSWNNSWGGDNAGRPWKSDNQVDSEAGDSGGYRGRGRGRGQYGGRGRGSERNGDRSNSGFGRESDVGDGPKWGSKDSSDWNKGAPNKGSWGCGDNWNTTNPSSSQPWSSSEGTESYGEKQPSTWNSSEDNKPSLGEQNDPWASKVASTEGKEQQNDTWASKITCAAGVGENSGGWNTKANDSSCSNGGVEIQSDTWATKIGSTKGKEETDPWSSNVFSTAGTGDNNDSWNTKAKGTPSGSVGKWNDAASGSSGAEERTDPWSGKGGNGISKKTDDWGAGSSGGHQESSWDKPNSSLGDQEPAWSKSRFGDDNNSGYGRGGFGRGNRGRGRGRNFGDSGSSWNGGNINHDSGGERSEDQWNGRDFDGGRGRGRGRFGRGDRNQGTNFGSGDSGSWGSDRGNGGRGGYKNWNDNNERRSSGQGGGWSNKGRNEAAQDFPRTSSGDDQAGKSDGNNTWSQNTSLSSILGQPSGNAKNFNPWGAPSDTTAGGGAGSGSSWQKSNEDSWNSSRGTEKSSWGGSEAAVKKDGPSEKGGEAESQGGGGGSSWDKADDAWNSNKGSDAGSGGW